MQRGALVHVSRMTKQPQVRTRHSKSRLQTVQVWLLFTILAFVIFNSIAISGRFPYRVLKYFTSISYSNLEFRLIITLSPRKEAISIFPDIPSFLVLSRPVQHALKASYFGDSFILQSTIESDCYVSITEKFYSLCLCYCSFVSFALARH